MRRFAIALSLLIMLLSGQAYAQAHATRVSNDAHGYTFLMCNAETTTGICDSGVNDIYAVVDKYRQFGFYYSATDNASSCDVYAMDGSRTPVADMTTLDNWKINGTAFSNTVPVQWFELTAKYMIVSCTVASGSVTMYMMAAEPSINRSQQ